MIRFRPPSAFRTTSTSDAAIFSLAGIGIPRILDCGDAAGYSNHFMRGAVDGVVLAARGDDDALTRFPAYIFDAACYADCRI